MMPVYMDGTADDLLRQKIRSLMKLRHMTQYELCVLLSRRHQSWLSRRLSGIQKFLITDLDALARAFSITVPELFFDEYGRWDRRSGVDRRSGRDRRTSQRLPVSRQEGPFQSSFPTARLTIVELDENNK